MPAVLDEVVLRGTYDTSTAVGHRIYTHNDQQASAPSPSGDYVMVDLW